MGIGSTGLQFALLGRRRGAKFERTLTLGRQHHFLDAWWVKMVFDRFEVEITEAEVQRTVEQPYSEPLFHALGALVVESMDASGYEGASIVHDLNLPVPGRFKQSFTCVVEYGTLEHVFNFPVALKSVIDMIEVGGHLLTITPTNNFMGHGFYQFSPELYFNFLSRNGFEDVEAYLLPYRWMPQVFRIANPRAVGGRVELVNAEPMQLGIIARKATHIAELVTPIQSDYQDSFWKGRDVDRTSTLPSVEPRLGGAIADFRRMISALASWPETLSPQLLAGVENSRHYQMIDPARD
jgi:hypothetical protein